MQRIEIEEGALYLLVALPMFLQILCRFQFCWSCHRMCRLWSCWRGRTCCLGSTNGGVVLACSVMTVTSVVFSCYCSGTIECCIYCWAWSSLFWICGSRPSAASLLQSGSKNSICASVNVPTRLTVLVKSTTLAYKRSSLAQSPLSYAAGLDHSASLSIFDHCSSSNILLINN